jgi:hypothetical protein
MRRAADGTATIPCGTVFLVVPVAAGTTDVTVTADRPSERSYRA